MQPPGDKIFRFSMKKGGINVYGEIFGISMHFMTEGCTCGYGEVELVTNNWSSSHPLLLIFFDLGNFSVREWLVFPILWSWQFFRSCTRRCGYANVKDGWIWRSGIGYQ